MSPLRRALRRIPGPIAIVLWILACLAAVYATLFWVPADWAWMQPGRTVGSRVPAGFRSAVSLILGFVSGVGAFAQVHGPANQKLSPPVFLFGLWVLAQSCAGLVPLVERLTGWQAAWSPFPFWMWVGLSIVWLLTYSKLYLPKT